MQKDTYRRMLQNARSGLVSTLDTIQNRIDDIDRLIDGLDSL